MIEDYKGDSAVYEFIVADTNIVGWKIEAEIWDDEDNNIKKATVNVPGGSNDQILITDAANGEFSIYIDKGETSGFSETSYIEIAIFITDQKDTIYEDTIGFSDSKISWESIP